MIDVTGPAASSHPDDVTDDVLPADDVMFVHVSDVRGLLRSVESEALPVVVYVPVRGNDSTAGKVLLQLMPSVNWLQSNEACRLGNKLDSDVRRLFAVEQKHAVSSVVFTRDVANKHQRYQLSIICQPILAPATEHHPQFTIYLHVQLV